MSGELRREANTRIAGSWLWLARVPLIALFVMNVIIYIVGTPVYFAQLDPSNHTCLQNCLTPANLQSLHALGFSNIDYAVYWTAINVLFALTYFAVAALIFWRKSDDWMALLASFFLVALGGSFADIPGVLAAVHPVWRAPVTLLSEDVIGFPSLVIFFLLFPNGRFVPRWTRWIAIGFVALFIAGSMFSGTFLNVANWPGLLFLPVPLVGFGTLVYAQIYRYRRVSTPVEQQQTRWIVFGAATALLAFLLLGFLLPRLLQLLMPLENVGLLPITVLITSIYLVLLLIPISLAIAVLHYRLWDIDALINKTLVYGMLTGILLAVYIGCIIGLQAIFREIVHQDSDVAIIISTLLIAALFQPLRKRIQAIIDRRFFRRKYDMKRTLAAFGTALRHDVDLDQLSEHLIIVVQETMQPAHISLWLRHPEPSLERNTRLLPLIAVEEEPVS